MQTQNFWKDLLLKIVFAVGIVAIAFSMAVIFSPDALKERGDEKYYEEQSLRSDLKMALNVIYLSQKSFYFENKRYSFSLEKLGLVRGRRSLPKRISEIPPGYVIGFPEACWIKWGLDKETAFYSTLAENIKIDPALSGEINAVFQNFMGADKCVDNKNPQDFVIIAVGKVKNAGPLEVWELTSQGVRKVFYNNYEPLKVACDSGDGKSCSVIGDAYSPLSVERQVEKNPAKALEYYEKACNLGDGAGCADLGTFFSDGVGVGKSPAKAIDLYEKACGLGDGTGCYTLGLIYRAGKGVEKSPAKANEYHNKACNIDSRFGCGKEK